MDVSLSKRLGADFIVGYVAWIGRIASSPGPMEFFIPLFRLLKTSVRFYGRERYAGMNVV
jgi:hypothetical protein